MRHPGGAGERRALRGSAGPASGSTNSGSSRGRRGRAPPPRRTRAAGAAAAGLDRTDPSAAQKAASSRCRPPRPSKYCGVCHAWAQQAVPSRSTTAGSVRTSTGRLQRDAPATGQPDPHGCARRIAGRLRRRSAGGGGAAIAADSRVDMGGALDGPRGDLASDRRRARRSPGADQAAQAGTCPSTALRPTSASTWAPRSIRRQLRHPDRHPGPGRHDVLLLVQGVDLNRRAIA